MRIPTWQNVCQARYSRAFVSYGYIFEGRTNAEKFHYNADEGEKIKNVDYIRYVNEIVRFFNWFKNVLFVFRSFDLYCCLIFQCVPLCYKYMRYPAGHLETIMTMNLVISIRTLASQKSRYWHREDYIIPCYSVALTVNSCFRCAELVEISNNKPPAVTVITRFANKI